MTAHRNGAHRRRARWMGPAMMVLAGVATGGPAVAETVEIPEWRNAFASHGVTGTMVLRRLGEKRSFVSDLDGADRGLQPASTFRIPHLLIAFETGVARPFEQDQARDDRRYRVTAGTADHNGRAAGESASVPAFQTISRGIGADRMAAWLARLHYGNADLSGGLDRFWLDGLKVTPAQQVDFVERLLLGTLPASTRSQLAARDAVPGERLDCDVTIRAKAGWLHATGEDGADVGWWVGWVERPREVWLFATAVEGHPDRVRAARGGVTLEVLERVGLIRSGPCDGRAEAPALAATLTASRN